MVTVRWLRVGIGCGSAGNREAGRAEAGEGQQRSGWQMGAGTAYTLFHLAVSEFCLRPLHCECRVHQAWARPPSSR